MKNTLARSAAAMALLIGCLTAQLAEAAFVVDLTQVADKSQPSGFDVVANGKGSINLTDLTFNSNTFDVGFLQPNSAIIFVGPTSITADTYYTGISGPLSFGSGGTNSASTGSDDIVGTGPFAGGVVAVPSGYVSGSHLSGSATWDNATLASLGATVGIYTWTWGSGANADSFTLKVGCPNPRPGR
jgi:hypothetical protein